MAPQRAVSIIRDPPVNPVDDGPDGGIGISLRKSARNGLVVVSKLVQDGAACKSGVVVGDILLEVEGTNTGMTPMGDIISLIKGTPGLPVLLLLESPSSPTSTPSSSAPTTPTGSPTMRHKSPNRTARTPTRAPEDQPGGLAGDLVTVAVVRASGGGETGGEEIGIGLAFVRSSEGNFYVSDAVAGSPAAVLAGEGRLSSGDEVHAIDGCTVRGRSTAEVVRLIKGRPGTNLFVTLRRGGEAERRIVREELQGEGGAGGGLVPFEAAHPGALRASQSPAGAAAPADVSDDFPIPPLQEFGMTGIYVDRSSGGGADDARGARVPATQAHMPATQAHMPAPKAHVPAPKDISPTRADAMTNPRHLPSPSNDSASFDLSSPSPITPFAGARPSPPLPQTPPSSSGVGDRRPPRGARLDPAVALSGSSPTHPAEEDSGQGVRLRVIEARGGAGGWRAAGGVGGVYCCVSLLAGAGLDLARDPPVHGQPGGIHLPSELRAQHVTSVVGVQPQAPARWDEVLAFTSARSYRSGGAEGDSEVASVAVRGQPLLALVTVRARAYTGLDASGAAFRDTCIGSTVMVLGSGQQDRWLSLQLHQDADGFEHTPTLHVQSTYGDWDPSIIFPAAMGVCLVHPPGAPAVVKDDQALMVHANELASRLRDSVQREGQKGGSLTPPPSDSHNTTTHEQKDLVIQQLSSEVEALRAARDEAFTHADRLKRGLEEAEERLREAEALQLQQGHHMKQQLDEAIRKAAHSQASIEAHAKSHMDTILADHSALQSKVAVLQQEVDRLRDEAESPEQRELSASAKAAKDGGWEHNHALHAERESNRFLGESLQELQAMHAAAVERIRVELTDGPEAQELKRALRAREEEVKSLSWTLSKRDEEIKVLGVARALLEREADAIRRTRGEMEEELDKAREECSWLRSSQSTLREEALRLSREARESGGQAREARAEASDLTFRVASLEGWGPSGRPPPTHRRVSTPGRHPPHSPAVTGVGGGLSLRQASELASPSVALLRSSARSLAEASSPSESPAVRRALASARARASVSPPRSETPTAGSTMPGADGGSLSPVPFPVNGTLQQSIRALSEELSPGTQLSPGSPPPLGGFPRSGDSTPPVDTEQWGGSPGGRVGGGIGWGHGLSTEEDTRRGQTLEVGDLGGLETPASQRAGLSQSVLSLSASQGRERSGLSASSAKRRPMPYPSPVTNFGGKSSELSANFDHQNMLIDLARAEHRSDSVKKELLAAMEQAERCVNDLRPSFE